MRKSFKLHRRGKWDDTSTHTEVKISFFTWKENGFTGNTDTDRKTVGYPIRVNHSKAFGGASGTFSITMKKPETLSSFDYNVLWPDPEDVWVYIQWNCDGQIMDGMLGMLDSINASFTREGHGTRNEEYELHGRDFGKIFEETQLYLNPMMPKTLLSYPRIARITEDAIKLGTPEAYIKALTESWIGGGATIPQTWEMPPSLWPSTFSAWLDTGDVEKMEPLINGYTVDLNLLNPDQNRGSLWDAMQQYSNGVLNEMWLDLGPPKLNPFAVSDFVPKLYLRERKFPTLLSGPAAYDQLTTWDLDPSVVRGRQIAKGGASTRYNFWHLIPQGLGSIDLSAYVQQPPGGLLPGQPGANPIWNEKSIRRHGLRQWIGDTVFLPVNMGTRQPDPVIKDNNASIATLGLLAQWLVKIHDWYCIAPKQLSGMLHTSRVLPEIRIGHRVVEKTPDGNIIYYVEGVTHIWQYPGTGQTQLTVTRGEFEGSTLLADEYSGLATQDIIARQKLALEIALNSVGGF